MRFGPPHTPDIIKTLMLANLACFILQKLSLTFEVMFAAWPVAFWSGRLWQPFTYMWLHGDFMHIALNMFSLWMFGSPMAAAWGPRRFLRFYLLCGIGAGLLIVALPALPMLFGLAPFESYAYPTVGASGAIFGVILAYTLTWPDRSIMLLIPPVPVKAIWFIPLLFAVELLSARSANISHVGHFGGVLAGWILFRRETGQPLLPSKDQLLYRWRRYKMRRQLHEVRRDQQRSWRDDSRLH
jgi:membrane associated rhomboid family serine protease